MSGPVGLGWDNSDFMPQLAEGSEQLRTGTGLANGQNQPDAEDRVDARHDSRRATVEEIPDDDVLEKWVLDYPDEAGEILREGMCTFERWRREAREAGHSCWHPFASDEEWEIGQWMAKNLGQNQIEEFLKLSAVSPNHPKS